MDKLLTAEEICAEVFGGNIKPKTLCQYAASKQAPGSKIAGIWLFCRADIMEWFKAKYKCPSTNRSIPKTGISRSRTTVGLENLLALPTGKRRKSTTTNTKPISGARKN